MLRIYNLVTLISTKLKKKKRVEMKEFTFYFRGWKRKYKKKKNSNFKDKDFEDNLINFCNFVIEFFQLFLH